MLDQKKESQKQYDEMHAHLGKVFIKTYLKNRGYTLVDLKKLPLVEARKLRTEASIYSSNKLAEIEGKALFITKIHNAYSRK